MATNQNGNLIDDKGNVVVDFVWGNFPMQPNDVRAENGGGLLDYTLDSHNIVEDGWNGYPLYTPNNPGSQTGGVDYVTVPNVLGSVATDASALLGDLELNTTTASAATNSAKTVTAVSRTTGSTTIRFTASSHGYVAGNKVTVSGLDSEFNATWTVTNVPNSGAFDVVGTSTASYSASALTGSVVAVSGTVKAQSVAAGTKVAALSAITITPWA